MNVLLTSFGTRGDIQPLLALGRALAAAGHAVTFAGPPDYAAWIEGACVPFVAAGEPYATLLAEMEASPARALAALGRQVPAQFAALTPLVDAADVVISGSLEYATATLCEHTGTPRRAAFFSPAFVPAPSQPMPMVPLRGLPVALNRLTWWASDLAASRGLLPHIRRERAARGLPPVASAARHLCGEEVLLPFPVSLAAAPPDALVAVRPTGPWLLDDDAGLPAAVEAFLAAGPAPVYFGTGSMPGVEALRDAFVAAARRVGVRAIVAGTAARGEDPDVLDVLGPVPHGRLFPRCAAVVHHGGAGTTIAATLAGRPQVVVAYVADQHLHAAIVARMGLGPAPVSRRSLSPERLADALRDALARDGAPALHDAAAAVPRDGAREAVALVEALGGVTLRAG